MKNETTEGFKAVRVYPYPILISLNYNSKFLSSILKTRDTILKELKPKQPIDIDKLNEALYKACLHFKGEYIELSISPEMVRIKPYLPHPDADKFPNAELWILAHPIYDVRQPEPVGHIILSADDTTTEYILDDFKALYKENNPRLYVDESRIIPCTEYITPDED